jgi:hypothetical protein
MLVWVTAGFSTSEEKRIEKGEGWKNSVTQKEYLKNEKEDR